MRRITVDASDVMNLTLSGPGALQTILASVPGDGTGLTLVDVGLSDGIVEIGDGDQLVLDERVDLTLATPIVDTALPTTGGLLVKQGPAALTLTGLNGWTGGTTIREGLLRGDTDSLPGDFTVDSLGTLVFDQAFDAVFAGVISGAGGFVKEGAGNLTLSGVSSYAGGTTVSAGTLTLTGGLNANGDLTIDTLGTFVYDAAANSTLMGALNGTGHFVKMGGATTLTFAGGGLFLGHLDLEQGTVVDSSNALRGPATLSAATSLIFAPATALESFSYGGVVDGDGQLVKQGLGSLTLSGVNSYGGGTRLDAGTLRGDGSSLQGDIRFGGPATLDFLGGGSYAGVIGENTPGDGTVLKSGSGRLAMTGASTYTGPTSVTGGTLAVDGTLVSPTTVQGGGMLAGIGSLNAPVSVLGTVFADALGSPLTVQSIAFQPGSTLQVDLQEGDLGSELVVTGSADVNGGRVRVNPAPGQYAGAGSTVTILDAGTLNENVPFGVGPDFAFLDEILLRSGDALQLTIRSNGRTLSSFALTPNQWAVGRAFERAQPGAAGDLAGIFDAIAVLQPGQIPGLLDASSGELLGQLATPRLALGERLGRTLHRRMLDARWGESDALFVVAAPRVEPVLALDLDTAGRPGLGPAPGAPLGWLAAASGSSTHLAPVRSETGPAAWLDGYAISGGIDGGTGAADAEYKVWGGTLGADLRATPELIGGLALGYARSDLELRGRSGRAKGETIQGALYAGWVTPRYHLTANGRYAFTQNRSEREIVFGPVARRATARFDTQDWGGRVEGGLRLASLGPIALEPVVAFDLAHLPSGRIREKGAGALALAADGGSLDSRLGTAGGRLHARFDVDDEIGMVAELRAFYLHEYGDTERTVRARLGGSPGAIPFVVEGAAPPRDSVLVGLGWSASFAARLHVLADYDARLEQGRVQHGGSLSLRVDF